VAGHIEYPTTASKSSVNLKCLRHTMLFRDLGRSVGADKRKVQKGFGMDQIVGLAIDGSVDAVFLPTKR
jgi:hypothetical protein